MSDYTGFLVSKEPWRPASGRQIDPAEVASILFPFQREIVRWAVRRRCAAVFADCGMGKTLVQLEWLRHVLGSVGRGLIVAPLAVAQQTIREGSTRLGFPVRYCADVGDLGPGCNITNYDRIERFIGAPLDAIVLDESSILKSVDGKTRTLLIREFGGVPAKLCCTATPAPNDIAEIGNHAAFLGICAREEMLAMYFVHKGEREQQWRLKGHGRAAFWRWLASWAVALRRPSDVGDFDDGAFVLPGLALSEIVVPTDAVRLRQETGMLFPGLAPGIAGRLGARRAGLDRRIAAASTLIRSAWGTEQVIVWCGLNAEAAGIAATIGPAAVNVAGDDPLDEKEAKIGDFLARRVRVLVTKPSIAGFGLNLQQACKVLFLGIGDSYEAYYQCIRRVWRYGQKRPVECTIVVTDAEAAVVANVKRKEREATMLTDEMIRCVKEDQQAEIRGERAPEPSQARGTLYRGGTWVVQEGDATECLADLRDSVVQFSIYSPPFASLFVYSDSVRDVGNCRSKDEFLRHYGYVIREVLRVTAPGRLSAVHIAPTATTKTTDGVIGVYDLPGAVIQAHIGAGWIFHGTITVDKDPQAQAIRTKSKALLFVQLRKDSSWLRPALPDYVLLFRKPGENAVPVKPSITNEDWIAWARPVWYGIKESDTLDTYAAKGRSDEKHICPLQLELIRRAILLWSNPGELVLSPFAGIGSEGYVAVREGRSFHGIELKASWASVAAKNIADVEKQLPLQLGVAG